MKDDAGFPPKEFKNEDARKLWSSTDLITRREIVRACRELSEGAAIMKDKMMGRPKYAKDGFYGLDRAERKLYGLRMLDVSGGDLAEALQDVERLKAKLESDEAEIRNRRELLHLFGPIAKAKGQTLPEWIAARTNIESELRRDPLNGFFRICDLVELDPLKVLVAAKSGSSAEVVI